MDKSESAQGVSLLWSVALASMDKIAIETCHPQKDQVDICQPREGHSIRIKNVFNSWISLRDLGPEFWGEFTVAGHGGDQGIDLWEAKYNSSVFDRVRLDAVIQGVCDFFQILEESRVNSILMLIELERAFFV